MQIDLTQQNFLEVLPTIKNFIVNSDFIAFDFEFLGLDQSQSTLFDSPSQRYDKLRKSVTRYAPCQLGLSCYSQNSDGSYETQTYSIPLYQQFGGSNDITIKKDALKFLQNNNFDLENVFINGIQYCNRDQLNMISFDCPEYFIIECEFIENSKILSSFEIEIPQNLSQLEMVVISTKLKNIYTDFNFTVQNNVLNIEKVDEKTRNHLNDFENIILGVTLIIEMILNSKIPIVGHNCFIDLMYIHHYFIEKLPESYEVFKKSLHSKLPYIFDTKYFAKTEKVRQVLMEYGLDDNSFESLSTFFENSKNHQLIPNNLRNGELDEYNYHDAAFDSSQTGLIFIKLSHLYIGIYESTLKFPKMFQMIKDCAMNRIPLSLTDIEYCDLSKIEDKIGNRPDIIQLSKKSGGNILEKEKLDEEKKLNWQLNEYRINLRISKNQKIFEIATNSSTTYASVCEIYSKSENWSLLNGNRDSYEQRLKSSRKAKNHCSELRNMNFHISRIENIITNKATWGK
ncbi:unnamed protein product [Caenorhabditis angaria]|uniref:Uncharacterized protein n=1 Tax=Caenorhabditis angaria TaxID=860376 RepID=A0A9P1N8J5_9PELO|nr:unnamed protein product [Caenorhabditis angaria]